MPAKCIRITGLVQGVFFRDKTKVKADDLGLTGRVKNADDGSVEVHAEGAVDALASLEEWCHRGSPAAIVRSVESADVPEEGCAKFEIWW